jgi:RNA polymerase sigma factor (sigma-70 family)
MTDNELQTILQGCLQRQQSSQYKLYATFYNYAMTVARRYVGMTEECEEIVNDSFVKVFNKLEQYTFESSFKAWLRRIVVNTSIDRIRAQKRLPQLSDLDNAPEVAINSDIFAVLTKSEILACLNQLSPAYRTVFNLFVIDEFNHEEIAEMLNISVGASKSNLSRARQHLKRIFEHEGKIHQT